MVVVVRDPVSYLCQFIGERQALALAPHDIVYILKTVAREILPAAGLNGRCPQIELFSDWMVHNKLDRSTAGQVAIARLAEAMPLHGQPGRDNKWLEEEVNGGISFWALRLELLAVCRRFNLPDSMFTTWDAWQRFALPLAFEVSGRPVHLGQDGRAAKSARDRIGKSGLDPDHHPHTMTLIRIEGDEPVKGLQWEAKLSNGVIVIIQVLLGGFRLTDFPTPVGWVSPV